MIDKQIGGNLEQRIKDKVIDVINSLSEFSVFRRKDNWTKEDSIAYRILQEEMKNSRPLIKSRIQQIIDEYPFEKINREMVGDAIYQCIMDKLFSHPLDEGAVEMVGVTVEL